MNQEIQPESPQWSRTTRLIIAVVSLIVIIWLVINALPLVESLVIAAMLAYLGNPVVCFVMRRLHLKRSVAALLVYVLFLLVLFSIPTSLGTLIIAQFDNWSKALLSALQGLGTWYSQPILVLGYDISPRVFVEQINQLAGDAVAAIPGGSLQVLSGVTTNLLWGLLILVSLFYFLRDGPQIKPWLVSLAPPAYSSEIATLINEIDLVLSLFLRVQVIIFFIIAALMAIGSGLVILLYRLGLLSLSPLGLILILVVLYSLVQQVDNLWLRPQMLGSQLRLHPGIVFVGIIGALALSGILGALLVVPVIAIVKILIRYVHLKMQDLPYTPLEGPADHNGKPTTSKSVPVVEQPVER